MGCRPHAVMWGWGWWPKHTLASLCAVHTAWVTDFPFHGEQRWSSFGPGMGQRPRDRVNSSPKHLHLPGTRTLARQECSQHQPVDGNGAGLEGGPPNTGPTQSTQRCPRVALLLHDPNTTTAAGGDKQQSVRKQQEMGINCMRFDGSA